MILSSDELQILEYLKSWKGTPISMVEICRCAGGRRKFRETPHWAKGLMSRLVESQLVKVNERGHYQAQVEETPSAPEPAPKPALKAKVSSKESHTVGGDYFPAEKEEAPDKGPHVVGGDYFPAANNDSEANADRWISPQMAEILKKSGKKFGRKTWDN